MGVTPQAQDVMWAFIPSYPTLAKDGPRRTTKAINDRFQDVQCSELKLECFPQQAVFRPQAEVVGSGNCRPSPISMQTSELRDVLPVHSSMPAVERQHAPDLVEVSA